MEKQPLPELGDCSAQRTRREADSASISSTLSLLRAPPIGGTEQNARGQGREDTVSGHRGGREEWRMDLENGFGEVLNNQHCVKAKCRREPD